jgi:hypothetical protein
MLNNLKKVKQMSPDQLVIGAMGFVAGFIVYELARNLVIIARKKSTRQEKKYFVLYCQLDDMYYTKYLYGNWRQRLCDATFFETRNEARDFKLSFNKSQENDIIIKKVNVQISLIERG